MGLQRSTVTEYYFIRNVCHHLTRKNLQDTQKPIPIHAYLYKNIQAWNLKAGSAVTQRAENTVVSLRAVLTPKACSLESSHYLMNYSTALDY